MQKSNAIALKETPNVFAKPESTPRFFSLMLHPLNDALECQGGGAIPSGSLLMWIDQMYEVPKTPGDRTFGFWPNVKATRQMFSHEAQKNMLYRIFNQRRAKSGEPSNPVEHGDFNEDNMCFWRPAFWGATNVPDWEQYYQDMPLQARKACVKNDNK